MGAAKPPPRLPRPRACRGRGVTCAAYPIHQWVRNQAGLGGVAGWLPAMPTAMAGRWCGAEAVGPVCRFAAGGAVRRRLGRFAAGAVEGVGRSRLEHFRPGRFGPGLKVGCGTLPVCHACRLCGGHEGGGGAEAVGPVCRFAAGGGARRRLGRWFFRLCGAEHRR